MSDADPAAVTRWSRRFVAAGAGWLVAWQAAALAGLGRSAGVALGLQFAFGGLTASLAAAHFRLNVLELLGLTVVGISYQFYPPTVGSLPGADDRTALASVALLFGGLFGEAAGLAAAAPAVVAAGRAGALLGPLVYAYLVVGAFRGRPVR